MDRREFEAKALEHLDAIYRMALQLSRRPEDASDLVQETYLKALKASERFETKGGGIKPWLFKILHNVFYSSLGKQRRTPTPVEDMSRESVESELDNPTPAWDLASLDWEQVDQRLKHAIDELDDRYRHVLLLWAVEGLKYREVADVLDIPLGTVMSRLHRARAILSEKLTALAREHGLVSGSHE